MATKQARITVAKISTKKGSKKPSAGVQSLVLQRNRNNGVTKLGANEEAV